MNITFKQSVLQKLNHQTESPIDHRLIEHVMKGWRCQCHTFLKHRDWEDIIIQSSYCWRLKYCTSSYSRSVEHSMLCSECLQGGQHFSYQWLDTWQFNTKSDCKKQHLLAKVQVYFSWIAASLEYYIYMITWLCPALVVPPYHPSFMVNMCEELKWKGFAMGWYDLASLYFTLAIYIV